MNVFTGRFKVCNHDFDGVDIIGQFGSYFSG